jgi:hypothetical protein
VQPTYTDPATSPSFLITAELQGAEEATALRLHAGFRFHTAERANVAAATAATGGVGGVEATPVWLHSRPLPPPPVSSSVAALWDGVALVAVQVCAPPGGRVWKAATSKADPR